MQLNHLIVGLSIFILLVAIGIPTVVQLINDIQNSDNSYSQIINANESIPYTLSHQILSVNSVYLLSSDSVDGNSDLPGSTNVSLSNPYGEAILTITTGGYGGAEVYLNGHDVGILDGTDDQEFNIQNAWLLDGVNTVEFYE
jgi:hypothetical protein